MKSFHFPSVAAFLTPHPCTSPLHSHPGEQVQFRELRLWWGLQKAGNSLILEGAKFNVCVNGVPKFHFPSTVCWRKAALRWESWSREFVVYQTALPGCTVDKPPVRQLSSNHVLHFNMTGACCICSLSPSLTCCSLLHLLLLNSPWS